MDTYTQKLIKETKKEILLKLYQELKEIETEKEIYFYDIISEQIDIHTPSKRNKCLNLIDSSEEKYFDSGLIDYKNLDRTLITMAYCSLEQHIFDDDFMQELQNLLNNELINKNNATKIYNKIEIELKKDYKNTGLIRIKDTPTQIFIKTNFSVNSLTKEDFIKYGILKEQIIDLSDSIKILTNNKSINSNALVITENKRNIEKKVYQFRVYLMEKNKNLDIRNLFKLQVINEETGFNLSPSAYIEQTGQQYEQDKQNNIKNYLSKFNNKTSFIKQIVSICNKLTELSLKENEII